MMIVNWSGSPLEGYLRHRWATDCAVGHCSWFSRRPRFCVPVWKESTYGPFEPDNAVGADTLSWVLKRQTGP